MKRYKFLREGLRSDSGATKWEIGRWKHEDKLELCQSGFHCSKEIYQAFSYVQGEILAEVEVKGNHLEQDDKEVWSDMKIVKAWKWQKKDSVALSIYAAELCLENFERVFPNDKRPREAIEAAKRWLKEPTKKNESAAASAAESAAWSARSAAASAASAAESAAWSARSAAASAAESAAWIARSAAASAAESAAWSAWSAAASAASARSAVVEKISTWMNKHLKELEVWTK